MSESSTEKQDLDDKERYATICTVSSAVASSIVASVAAEEETHPDEDQIPVGIEDADIEKGNRKSYRKSILSEKWKRQSTPGEKWKNTEKEVMEVPHKYVCSISSCLVQMCSKFSLQVT